MNAEDLLRRIVDIEPWGYDSEIGPSSCKFCPSTLHDQTDRPGHYTYRHHPHCVWMEAADFLGVEHEGHTFYVAPPQEPPCPICGWQHDTDEFSGRFTGPDSTGTYAEHFAHEAAEKGMTPQEYHNWLMSPMRFWELMPSFSSPRGGISFVTVLPPPAD